MTQQSNEPVPPAAVPPQQHYGVPAPGQNLGAVSAAPSPFAGIPARDYIVDATAALLLIISLFVPWSASFSISQNDNAASHIAVLLITIVSLLSLGLTYLWRSGVFGPSWNYLKMQDLRAAANVPYVVLFLVYLVITIAKDGAMYEAGAFGLAGALLAAQPRKSEMGSREETTTRKNRWIYVLWGTAGISVVVAFVQLIKTLISESNGTSAWPIIAAIVGGVLTPFLLIVIAKRVHGGSQPYRLVAIGLGLAGAFLSLVSLNDGPQAPVVISGSAVHFTAFVWMAFGAAAISPTLDALMAPLTPGEKWRQAHHAVLNLTLPIAVVAIVFSVLNLIGYHDMASGEETALFVMTLIFSVILGAGVIVVRQAFAGNTAQGYILSSVYSGIIFVLFLVLVIMAASTESWAGWLLGLLLLINFVIPSALLVLLWAPTTSRAEYTAIKGSPGMHSGFSFDGVPKAASAVPSAPAPARSPEEQLAEAGSPATPVSRLHELALNHPHTHDAILSNPSTYEELRRWVVQVREAKSAAADIEDPENATTSMQAPHNEVRSEESSAVASAPAQNATEAFSTQVAAHEHESKKVLPAAEETTGQASDVDGEVPEQDAIELTDVLLTSLFSEAGNPGTSGSRLQELAGSHPQLHQAILNNPSTYEGLRTWILAQQPGNVPTDIDPLAAEASNPETSGSRLQELAGSHPYLHPVIAGNPAAYPQLLQWLAQVNVPGVAEALNQR